MPIKAWIEKEHLYIAETSKKIIDWRSRRHGINKSKDRIRPALYVWLDEPIIPPYPNTAKQFVDILIGKNAGVKDILSKMLIATNSELPILVGSKCKSGIGYIGLVLQKPLLQGAPGRKHDAIQKGFRPGRVPPNIALARSVGLGAQVETCNVIRADHNWIHGRDSDPDQNHLCNCRVSVVGCGSLGSGVAKMLAQSGIGDIQLYDHELLEWENICRHSLGARAVGYSKAKALGIELKRDFPHLNSIEGDSRQVLPTSNFDPACFVDCDLTAIIHDTGRV